MEARIWEPRITIKNRTMTMTLSPLHIQTLEIPEMFDNNHNIISMIVRSQIPNRLVPTSLDQLNNPNRLNLGNLNPGSLK